jgi:hypothetical protein
MNPYFTFDRLDGEDAVLKITNYAPELRGWLAEACMEVPAVEVDVQVGDAVHNVLVRPPPTSRARTSNY